MKPVFSFFSVVSFFFFLRSLCVIVRLSPASTAALKRRDSLWSGSSRWLLARGQARTSNHTHLLSPTVMHLLLIKFQKSNTFWVWFRISVWGTSGRTSASFEPVSFAQNVSLRVATYVIRLAGIGWKEQLINKSCWMNYKQDFWWNFRCQQNGEKKKNHSWSSQKSKYWHSLLLFCVYFFFPLSKP